MWRAFELIGKSRGAMLMRGKIIKQALFWARECDIRYEMLKRKYYGKSLIILKLQEDPELNILKPSFLEQTFDR